MTKTEIIKIITTIRVQFPEVLQCNNITEREALVDIWFDILKEYPQELVWTAVKNALKNTIYQKQNWIGAICQEIENLAGTTDKTDGELWTELINALKKVERVTYFGMTPYLDNGRRILPFDEVATIYESLNPVLKDYVGSATELISLSKEESLDYEKGRFFKTVNQLRKREKLKQNMPVPLRILLQGDGEDERYKISAEIDK